MLQGIPIPIILLFQVTTLLTLLLFTIASPAKGRINIVIISIIWLYITAMLASKGFFRVANIMPPRFMLMFIPIIMGFITIFLTQTGKDFINQLNLKSLTTLHIVRVPVELCLYSLYVYKAIPELMTYSGRNFDILAGITSPIAVLLCFKAGVLTKKGLLLVWNFICTALLISIIINAMLSAPFPFQQFAFDQPNIAVLYYPFIWLPGFIVPVVLLSHIVVIKRLLAK